MRRRAAERAAQFAWDAAAGLIGLGLMFAEWRESRRPCTVCGDTPTDPAAQLCRPCLVWDRGDSYWAMRG